MGLKKRMIGMGCAIAVIVLCSVNMTYAWQNLTQTALNVNMGERWDYEQGSGGTQPPDQPGKPDDKDPEGPDAPTDPGNPGKPDEKNDPGGPGSSGQTPGPSEDAGSSGISNGKSDIHTGDTGEVMIYMLIMLLSFVLMSVGGGVLITLVIYKVDRRRK